MSWLISVYVFLITMSLFVLTKIVVRGHPKSQGNELGHTGVFAPVFSFSYC